ncbi:DNA cytosine methyltransferase [Pasteurellaceae bacterium TAE3-ERU1]|nr:DNA cytosine methyltransferase [Pasteurellaceae bacterium TAE3-ERU1]
MRFTYGSVCSGIEAVSCAWDGFAEPLWFSEIEPFPCAVLAHHYPDVPNVGDMTMLPSKILNREIPAPDVLVGGTPCQAFSVAGNRLSLEDERGNLTLKFIQIANAIDTVRIQDGKEPCIIIWENVPGVLNTKDNAFGHLLAGMVAECEPLQPAGKRWTNAGYVHGQRTVVWRVLDAQYFGVPQRRRRVFLVASARKRSVCEILFERKGLRRDISESRQERESATTYIETGFAQYRESEQGGTLKASGGVLGSGSETFVVHGSQDPICSDKAHCIGRNNGLDNVLFDISHRQDVIRPIKDKVPTLTARMGTGGNNIPLILKRNFVVRKLTPVECERLQGFPDDWTKVPYRNKPAENCPDSPRYKAIGNSMAVPVMRWIGNRVTKYLSRQNGGFLLPGETP